MSKVCMHELKLMASQNQPLLFGGLIDDTPTECRWKSLTASNIRNWLTLQHNGKSLEVSTNNAAI